MKIPNLKNLQRCLIAVRCVLSKKLPKFEPLNLLIEYGTVLGATGLFVESSMKLYDTRIPSVALMSAVKGALIDCTPPVKYPALCGAWAACCFLSFTTGRSEPMTAAISLTQFITKSTLG